MTTTVRAKFTVTGLKQSTHGKGYPTYKVVVLSPQYDTSIPEDKRFSDATPGGLFEMAINNPAAIEALMPGGELGHSFYIDLTPAE